MCDNFEHIPWLLFVIFSIQNYQMYVFVYENDPYGHH